MSWQRYWLGLPSWLLGSIVRAYLALLCLLVLLNGVGMIVLWYWADARVPGEMLLRWLGIYCLLPLSALTLMKAGLRWLWRWMRQHPSRRD